MAERSASAGSHPPAPGEDVSCALALVNTRFMSAGRPVDLIADASGATEWLTGRGLLPRGAAVSGQNAARLGALRETIRALFAARADTTAPVPGDLSALNAALAGAPLVPALTWDDVGPRRDEQLTGPAADPVDVALARLAGDALGVLTGAGEVQAGPVRRARVHPLVPPTHAARQWCSARCGDRVRAARHYARHHQ